MKFETLKRWNKWYVIGGVVIIVGIIIATVITTSRAKYRVTQSIPFVRGTINYRVPDLNIFAMYQENDSGEFEVIDSVPTSGYKLNTTQSQCTVNGVQDTSISINYGGGKVTVSDLTKRGTKCYLYFDKSNDTTVPTISNVTSSVDKTSITVTVTASDDEGLSIYYFSINDGAYISKTTNSHTFSGLTVGTSYTIKVYVTDTSGNQSVVTTKTIKTKTGNTMSEILAGYTQSTRSSFSAVITDATTKQVYSVADDLGTSLYFAGAPTDNWVYFGDFYWRIIRMNGDGSTRLIYAGSSPTTTGTDDQLSSVSSFSSSYNDNAGVGYMYGATGASHYAVTHANANDSTIKRALDTWYNNLSSVAEYIDGNAGFCNDRGINSGIGYGTSDTRYTAWNRLMANRAPSLKCTNAGNDLFTTSGSSRGNGKLTKPIGLITADEVAYAGGVYNTNNTSYYLYTEQDHWTLSPCYFAATYNYAYGFIVDSSGTLYVTSVNASLGVRPVINLKADTQFTGSGLANDPFQVAA